jgi:hypothetical protein
MAFTEAEIKRQEELVKAFMPMKDFIKSQSDASFTVGLAIAVYLDNGGCLDGVQAMLDMLKLVGEVRLRGMRPEQN